MPSLKGTKTHKNLKEALPSRARPIDATCTSLESPMRRQPRSPVCSARSRKARPDVRTAISTT